MLVTYESGKKFVILDSFLMSFHINSVLISGMRGISGMPVISETFMSNFRFAKTSLRNFNVHILSGGK